MIREVLTIGDERLLKISKPVASSEFNTKELFSLIEDMRDTMHERGGVGIAAVQIGVHKRITLIEYDGSNPRYAQIGDCPLTVIINPQIEAVDNILCEYNEGCLSVPDMRGIVERPKHIRYKFYNQYGELISGDDDGFFVRVMQHEIDHMDGILFPERVTDKSTLKATTLG
jgi:peptide deformylase